MGLRPSVIYPAKENMQKENLSSGETAYGVKCSAGKIKPLVLKAYELGDVEEDILIFATSTLVTKTRFRHVVGIQHGIYWDVDSIHGKKVSGSWSSLLLRMIQAKQQLDLHRLVNTMVCVDLNYVNWMRSLTVANKLSYTYIPNFAEVAEGGKRTGKDTIDLVFARRFEEIRGCGLLIEVLPPILSSNSTLKLTVAGGGSMEPQLRRAFSGNNQVSFASYDAADSIAFHSRFDIAIVPTVASEGTSLSLLEAMSAGCAVIATDVGGMSNILLDGFNGLQIEPTADALKQAIELLVSDEELRNRLSECARNTISSSFSHDVWASKWQHVIQSLLGE